MDKILVAVVVVAAAAVFAAIAALLISLRGAGARRFIRPQMSGSRHSARAR